MGQSERGGGERETNRSGRAWSIKNHAKIISKNDSSTISEHVLSHLANSFLHKESALIPLKDCTQLLQYKAILSTFIVSQAIPHAIRRSHGICLFLIVFITHSFRGYTSSKGHVVGASADLGYCSSIRI